MSCSKQSWRNSNTVIQPLACAPEHCVYICNLTYPPGSQSKPPSAPTTMFSLSLSFSALCAVVTLSLSLSFSLPSALSISSLHSLPLARSHHRVIPFFSYTKIHSSKYTHTLSHIDTHTQTRRGPRRYTHVRRSHSLNVSEPLQPDALIKNKIGNRRK